MVVSLVILMVVTYMTDFDISNNIFYYIFSNTVF